jgi:hypothetical protein
VRASGDSVNFRVRVRFTCGFLTAVAALLGAAELHLRSWPPEDLKPFLGDRSPAVGAFVADPDFGYTLRSFAELRARYSGRLEGLVESADARPLWAFFGNSFVQAPGMLADTARAKLRERRIFHLGRNEPLELEVAEAAMLLDNGLRPERLFVLLMPVDCLLLGPRPLSTIRITRTGALGYRVRRPPLGLGWLIDRSRVAMAAWVRSGRHVGNPSFRRRRLLADPGATLLADLRRLVGGLARAAGRHHVPVTLILVPAYEQIRGDAPFEFQNAVKSLFRPDEIDVFDARAAFLAPADDPDLFLPDKHFTSRGNELLLDALVQHVRSTSGALRRP